MDATDGRFRPNPLPRTDTPMRRAALAAAFLGLLGLGLGCKASFGRCDCLNDPSCEPLPAYNNPSAVVGPTQSGIVPASYPVTCAPGMMIPTPGIYAPTPGVINPDPAMMVPIVPTPAGPPAVIPPSPSSLPDMNIPVPVKEGTR